MLNLLCARELESWIFWRQKLTKIEPEHEHEHDIDTIIEVGKEKGYLTYGDVNEMLPEEIGYFAR